MIDGIIKNEQAGTFSRRQQLFVKYTLFILIDLVVLNLFNEFWVNVTIEYFSISLMAALLLQILLQLTIAIEHRVANLFKGDTGLKSKILRGLSTWAILFISKLVILEAINYAFGDSVLFSGPVHGLIAFMVVVMAIIIAEQAFLRLYRLLTHT
jgi:hypothetical protein